VQEYNNQKVEGTPYRRQAITRENFLDFVSKLFKEENPEALFASSTIKSFNNERWNKKIFKFNLGQKVLLARRANWKNKKVQTKVQLVMLSSKPAARVALQRSASLSLVEFLKELKVSKILFQFTV